jgi:hypothetical protein
MNTHNQALCLLNRSPRRLKNELNISTAHPPEARAGTAFALSVILASFKLRQCRLLLLHCCLWGSVLNSFKGRASPAGRHHASEPVTPSLGKDSNTTFNRPEEQTPA